MRRDNGVPPDGALRLRFEEAIHDGGHALPAFCGADELPASATGNGVEAGAAVIFGFAPIGADPAALLQPQQGGVDGALIEHEGVTAYLLDAPREAIAVQRAHGRER